MMMLALLAATMGPADAKTTAMDDWGKLQIYGVGGEPTGPLYLQAHARRCGAKATM